MKIRAKIVTVVVPILVVSVLLVGASSVFLAQTGINRLARDFLGFKATELRKYAVSQYGLLVDNNLQGSEEYIQATKGSIELYAKGIATGGTELIFAVDSSGGIQMSSGELTVSDTEKQALAAAYKANQNSLFEINAGGTVRVAKGFFFEPFNWYILVTESRSTFYQDVYQIIFRTLYLLGASLFLAIFVLYMVTTRLVRPLNNVINTMKEIISTNDLSKDVPVEFADETGILAHTFNIMIRALNRAYSGVKQSARNEAIAKIKETKIRQIFQRYVPQELIDQFYANPDSMLVGQKRPVAILFSDIRGFTSISEETPSERLVPALNEYFDSVLPVIVNENKGMVDKYIGDAIMAIFGAPIDLHDDHLHVLNSVKAGLGMLDIINTFNDRQLAKGNRAFVTGIGINFGSVTVGNIGSELKMDYTVIGDPVNLASRIEGQTKVYKESLIITQSVKNRLKDKLPTRLLDTIAVKGKNEGIRIYTVRHSLDPRTEQAWKVHHRAMDAYYDQSFREAAEGFEEVGNMLPGDYISEMMMERCREYIKHPPGSNWDGIERKKEK